MAERDDSFSCSKSRNLKTDRTRSWMRQLKSRGVPVYFRKKYEKIILNALEAIERDIVLAKPIQWKILLRVVPALRVSDKAACGCLKFISELFNLFERYQCRNAWVISAVFKVLYSLTTENFYYLNAYNMQMRELCYRPYGATTNDPSMDLVWNAVRSGNLCLLKLQLKFGMLIMTPYAIEQFCNKILDVLLRRMWDNSSNDSIEDAMLEVTCDSSSTSIERLHLILRILEIIIIMQCYPKFEEHYIKCYKLLFDSIPEAYVTSSEVKSSLEKCIPETYSALISKITGDFKRLLPKFADVPQPRSLKHLCRFQVRESLRRNRNLHYSISSLPLPAALKKYIMLHDDGDYSIIIKSLLEFNFGSKAIQFPRPISFINIPERDDCMTSFLKGL